MTAFSFFHLKTTRLERNGKLLARCLGSIQIRYPNEIRGTRSDPPIQPLSPRIKQSTPRPLDQGQFQIEVARATRLLRPATCRKDLPRAIVRKGRTYCLEAMLPFLPASRRTAQAGRLGYQNDFSITHSEIRVQVSFGFSSFGFRVWQQSRQSAKWLPLRHCFLLPILQRASSIQLQ